MKLLQTLLFSILLLTPLVLVDATSPFGSKTQQQSQSQSQQHSPNPNDPSVNIDGNGNPTPTPTPTPTDNTAGQTSSGWSFSMPEISMQDAAKYLPKDSLEPFGALRLSIYTAASMVMEYFKEQSYVILLLIFSAFISISPIADASLREGIIAMFKKIYSSNMKIFNVPVSYIIPVIAFVLCWNPLSEFFRRRRVAGRVADAGADVHQAMVALGVDFVAGVCNIFLVVLMVGVSMISGTGQEQTGVFTSTLFITLFILSLAESTIHSRALTTAGALHADLIPGTIENFAFAIRKVMNVIFFSIVLIYFKDRITKMFGINSKDYYEYIIYFITSFSIISELAITSSATLAALFAPLGARLHPYFQAGNLERFMEEYIINDNSILLYEEVMHPGLHKNVKAQRLGVRNGNLRLITIAGLDGGVQDQAIETWMITNNYIYKVGTRVLITAGDFANLKQAVHPTNIDAWDAGQDFNFVRFLRTKFGQRYIKGEVAKSISGIFLIISAIFMYVINWSMVFVVPLSLIGITLSYKFLSAILKKGYDVCPDWIKAIFKGIGALILLPLRIHKSEYVELGLNMFLAGSRFFKN